MRKEIAESSNWFIVLGANCSSIYGRHSKLDCAIRTWPDGLCSGAFIGCWLERFGKAMEFLAKYTMPIFLMHTLFTAPLRSILLKIRISNAVVHVILGLGISFIGPIVATWIMKKTKWLEFFLYLNKFLRKVKSR